MITVERGELDISGAGKHHQSGATSAPASVIERAGVIPAYLERTKITCPRCFLSVRLLAKKAMPHFNIIQWALDTLHSEVQRVTNRLPVSEIKALDRSFTLEIGLFQGRTGVLVLIDAIY